MIFVCGRMDFGKEGYPIFCIKFFKSDIYLFEWICNISH